MIHLLILGMLVVSSSWTVGGWAVDLHQDEHGCVAYMVDGITKVKCPPSKPTCEQRMKEAMRSIKEYINEAHIPGPESPFRKEFFEIRKQWGSTMKDCVEGRS